MFGCPVAPVKGARRSHEVAGIVHAGMPDNLLAFQEEPDAEVVGVEHGVAPVLQQEAVGPNGEYIAGAGRGEIRDGKVPVDHRKGGPVFKDFVGSPFHPYQPGREDGETGM